MGFQPGLPINISQLAVRMGLMVHVQVGPVHVQVGPLLLASLIFKILPYLLRSFVKFSICSYERAGWLGSPDLRFSNQDLGKRAGNFSPVRK